MFKRACSRQLEAQLNTLQKDGPAAWATLPEEELFTPAGFSSQQAEATASTSYSYWGSTFRAFFKNRVAVLLLVALAVFIQIVVLIAQLYFAITLANTRALQKLGGFAAVIVFFAVFIVMQVISVLLSQYVPLSIVLTSEGLFYSTTSTMADPLGLSFGIAGMIFNVLCSAALFWGTAKLMNTKVNIK